MRYKIEEELKALEPQGGFVFAGARNQTRSAAWAEGLKDEARDRARQAENDRVHGLLFDPGQKARVTLDA